MTDRQIFVSADTTDRRVGRAVVMVCLSAAVIVALSCTSTPQAPSQRTFAAPEDAVRALTDAVKAGHLDDLLAIFGPAGQELIDSSDAQAARRNREVFMVAVAEKWRLVDEDATSKTLVVGNEEWPFPVPLRRDGNSWRFDTAAGKAEVLARRIGRNELAAIRICRTYVTAQRMYALHGHDGKRAGLYAANFRSDPGRQNGLYWPAARGQKRSPLGDLIAQAQATPDPDRQPSAPFHGYLFKILTAQGANATGGAGQYAGGRRDVGRVCAGRMAGAARRHRCHELPRQSGRYRS